MFSSAPYFLANLKATLTELLQGGMAGITSLLRGLIIILK